MLSRIYILDSIYSPMSVGRVWEVYVDGDFVCSKIISIIEYKAFERDGMDK